MTRVEFGMCFDEFYECFGGAQHNDVQKRILWDRLQYINRWELKTVLQTVMENAQSSRLPMPGVIINAARQYITQAAARMRDKRIALSIAKRGRRCEYCGHTGMITADKKSEPKAHGTAFRCTFCDTADIIGLSRAYFEPWGQHHEAEWNLRLMKPSDRTDANKRLIDKSRNLDGSINPTKLVVEANKEPTDLNSPEWKAWFASLPKERQETIYQSKLSKGEIWQ